MEFVKSPDLSRSDTIYGVIIGRAIAGAGAVSAVVMALLADVTREEHRPNTTSGLRLKRSASKLNGICKIA
jgi:hypothetical protein